MKNTDVPVFGLYQAIGEDITDVLERLEDIETVETFALEFLDDQSYSVLLNSLNDNDLKGAFQAAHTLKGIGYTLGFKRLGNCAAELCDKLKAGAAPSEVIQRLKTEYSRVFTEVADYKKSAAK